MSRAKTKNGNSNYLIFSSDKHEKSARIMRAMAHPLRMRIIEFIDKNRSVNVNKIYHNLKLEQSITSQHLKILREAGLVKTSRDGKFIHYSLDYDAIQAAVKVVNKYL
jgi:ArsR family transcriptional regulator